MVFASLFIADSLSCNCSNECFRRRTMIGDIMRKDKENERVSNTKRETEVVEI